MELDCLGADAQPLGDRLVGQPFGEQFDDLDFPPCQRLARQLEELTADVRARKQRYEGAMAALRPRYVAALREYVDGPIAPDANGTLRITFGTVRGYRSAEKDQEYAPFTTVSEMVAKHTGEDPFVVPPSVLAAAKGAKTSPWADERLGDVPLFPSPRDESKPIRRETAARWLLQAPLGLQQSLLTAHPGY